MELANGHYTSGSEIGIYNGGKIPLTVDFLAYIESRTVGVDEMLKVRPQTLSVSILLTFQSKHCLVVVGS